MLRLKDHLHTITSDVVIGVITSKYTGREKVFSDISELSAQFTMDYVTKCTVDGKFAFFELAHF